MLAPGVAQRAPAAAVAVSPAEAARLGIREGQRVRLSEAGGPGAAAGSLDVPVVLRDLPDGVAAVTAGLTGDSTLRLPAIVSVKGAGA